MKLYKKLMLSLVGLTSIILIATLFLARWSFEQGFQNFLQNQELIRLERISNDIKQIAPSVNSLQEINKKQLENILGRHALPNRPPRGPKPRRSESQMRPPPPPYNGGLNANKDIGKPQPSQATRPSINTARPEPYSFLFTAVYDELGNIIAGDTFVEPARQNYIVFDYPINVNNTIVGSLKSWKKDQFDSPIANDFARQQLTTSIIIGCFGLALAFILSYFGAKNLLTPIHHLMRGVEDLSTGNYTRQLTNERQDEFGELIKNVNHLGNVLEQTRTAKNRWFADISHELRTPLTVLMGELEALKMGIRPFSIEQLDSLFQETQLLKRLIDDLYQLSVSEIGALRYEFAQVDISTLLLNIVEQTMHSAKEKSITLIPKIQSDVIIDCDEDRINQLFTNILNNSVAYTNHKGIINVSLDVQKDAVHICFEDSAPSLSTSECTQIFEPLYRHNKARTRNAGGAGLGLAISKNIVQAHGGNISANPSEIGGLVVSVLLPLATRMNPRVNK